MHQMGFPGGSDSKESACCAGDTSSIPGWGRSPGKRNDTNELTYKTERDSENELMVAKGMG